MIEDMFLDPVNDWAGLDPDHILALRAVAPPRVFTDKAGQAYAAAVKGDTELSALVSALFASDLEVITELPEAHRALAPQLVALMRLSYRHRIRLEDPRISRL